MFNELLGFGFVLAFVFLASVCGAVRMGSVLNGLFIVEVRRGDEPDDLFEGVFWVFPDEEVYECGYTAEDALKVADNQS